MTAPMPREELAKRFADAPIWEDDDDEEGFVAVDISPTERNQIVEALRGVAQQLPSKFSPGDAVEVRRIDSNIDEIVIRRGDVHIEQLSDDGWFMGVNGCDGSYWQFWFGSKNRKSHVEFRHTETITAEEEARRVAALAPLQPGSLQMTPSTRATCKFCGTVALPNDEQNCSSLDEAYRQTPTRPYGCPWFDKDARKANPAPAPSTPASTDAGALADGDGMVAVRTIQAMDGTADMDAAFLMDHIDSVGRGQWREIIKSFRRQIIAVAAETAALRNSAPQETRGDEPVSDPMRDLALMWGCRANALRILNSHREEPDAASDQAIETYEECADELRKALDASQQSPRLEREEVRTARLWFEQQIENAQQDQISGFASGPIVRGERAHARHCALYEAQQVFLALLSPDTAVVSSTDHSAVDAIAERSPGISKGTIRNLLDAELCDDCPPVGYPTDKRRCTVCPRVSSKMHREVE